MKILLKKDVEKLGISGEVKDVAYGYARNYLIPRGLAAEATRQVLREWEQGMAKRKAREGEVVKAAQELAGKLSSISLSFSRAVGPEGRIFGSVGKSDVVKSLKASGFAIEKSAVALDPAFKKVGDYEVDIRLKPGVSARLKVSIIPRT